MSRQIDLSKPLSEEDRQYLVDRADNVSLERNAALVAGDSFVAGFQTDDPSMVLQRGGEGGDAGGTGEPPAPEQPKAIEDMLVPELQEELRKLELPVSGTKDELLARLVEARDSSTE